MYRDSDPPNLYQDVDLEQADYEREGTELARQRKTEGKCGHFWFIADKCRDCGLTKVEAFGVTW